VCIGGHALATNAQDIGALSIQADSLAKMGEFQKAAELYLHILERTPEDVDAMLSLGKMYLWTGKYVKAEERLTSVINLTPEYEDAYPILANVYLNQGRTQDAIDILKQLWERNPNRSDVILRLLHLYHQVGNYREARSIQKMLRDRGETYKLSPNIERDLYAWRGDVHYTYEKIDLIPDWSETILSMAYCWRKGFTAVGTFQRLNRFEKVNLMPSISAYFSLPVKVHWYVNLGYTQNSDFLPDFRADIRAQTQMMRGSSLIAGTSFLSFPTDQFQIYSLGAEQYFSGRFSVSYQYFISEPNASFSHLLRANGFGDHLTSTLGYAWGNEIFRVVSSEELGDVKTQTCFGTLTYWFKRDTGIKLNLSYAERIHSYTRRGIGGGLVFKF